MPHLKSTYKILKEYNLVIQCHSGPLDLESYTNFTKKVNSDPLFSPNQNQLVCMRKATFKVKMSDVFKFIKFTSKFPETSKKRRISIITDTPNQVAPLTLYKLDRQNSKNSIEVFSTFESAIDWLDIKDLKITDVESLFHEV